MLRQLQCGGSQPASRAGLRSREALSCPEFCRCCQPHRVCPLHSSSDLDWCLRHLCSPRSPWKSPLFF